MSYVTLYRKFRPRRFEDVKGQDHIVTALRNQVIAGRVGHAYLFCGTRGTGKTSVAKIMARTVNCENITDGGPCGECPSCKTISSGSSTNVIEMDAASNNGVDNIREIVDEVVYSPAQGRYKVYIIDEVHMLSTGAFNALLKTLEEPPAYVIFILATTEVHKIPVTILSRCQRYDFKRIGAETIYERLKETMEIEKADVEDKALRYVAKAADGAMRDALSILDQCLAFKGEGTLKYEDVLNVLGVSDTIVFSRIACGIIQGDVSGTLKILEESIMDGREITRFIADLTFYFRNLLVLKSIGDVSAADADGLINVSTGQFAALLKEVNLTDSDTLIRYIRVLSELTAQLRYAADKRVLAEVALIKLCKPQMEADITSIKDRLRQIENKLKDGIVSASPAPTAVKEKPKKRELPRAVPEDIKAIVVNWGKIIAKLGMPDKTYAKNAVLSLSDDGKLILAYDDMNFALVDKEERKKAIEDAIAEFAGKSVEVYFKKSGAGEKVEDVYPDLSGIAMEIEIE